MRDTLGTAEAGAWRGGIAKAIDPAQLSANASPRGLNTALALSRTGVPFVQKREGVRCLTETPLTGSQAILGQHDYVETSTGTRRHLVSTATRIAVKAVDGTFTVLSSALTSSTPPDWATVNSMAFIVNGTDALKVRGTTVETFGIARPTVGTLAGAAGVAGLHNGTYELRVAFKNGNTGAISSASDTASATVTCTNDVIDWSNIPVSADTQVTQRLLLVRNTSTQTQFYVAGTVNDNSSTTAQTSVLDANLVTLAPTTTSNGTPPSGAKYLTVYKGRLVVATDTAIYWAKIDEPEAFDALAFDGVSNDGDVITGIFADQETLLVTRENKTYAITGDLGDAYTVELIDANVGCTAHRTFVSAGGSVYWWSRHGIVRYNAGAVERVGLDTYGSPEDTVNADQIALASAVAHDDRSTIYFALPGIGQERATFLLPYNYALGVLESEKWDPMDCASLGECEDSSGVMQPVLGGYAGQVFRLWDTNADGIATSTTSTGTFTASSASITSLTDLTATFDTTGGGLIERKITILDSDGESVTASSRPRITANTATQLTFTPAVTLTSGATYTYIVGGPDFQFDTPWRDFGDPWVKKRFEYLFLMAKGTSYGSAATIVMAFNYDDANANGLEQTFTSSSASGTWDDALWDVDVWDTPENVRERFRIGRVGRCWRVRLSNPYANQPFALLYIAAQATPQTTKR